MYDKQVTNRTSFKLANTQNLALFQKGQDLSGKSTRSILYNPARKTTSAL